MKRLGAILVCASAFVFPSNGLAQEQPVIEGFLFRFGLNMPLRINDAQVTHVDRGAYTFALLDQFTQHSFHVRGPFDRPGVSAEIVNFGTAGPDGSNLGFVSNSPVVFENVQLQDGLYRYHCDRHSDFMQGSFPVGNYLSVEVESGRGTIESPAGISCSAICGLGQPDGSPPVTLTAVPNAGYRFDRWSGGPCSGDGPCTVVVTGLVEVKAVFAKLPPPPPPPEEPAPALLTKVKVTKAAGARVVTLTLDVDAQAQATAQLRRSTKILATAKATLLPGTRTLKLRVPRAAKAGAATVRLVLKSASGKTFTVTRSVRLPAL
jgi:Divergent InlB B-repeat domain